VPNDNYRIDEGHRLLTYLVSPTAHVTVLTRTGDPAGFGATPITVSEVSQLVRGQKPVELFEPLDTGVWIRGHIDTACAIDQKYHPEGHAAPAEVPPHTGCLGCRRAKHERDQADRVRVRQSRRGQGRRRAVGE